MEPKITPSKQSQFSNFLVNNREKLLDLIARSTRRNALNDGSTNVPEIGNGEFAGKLKTVLDKIFTEGISTDGYSVDYKRIKTSAAYHEFQKEYYPKLRSFNPATLISRQEKLAFWINIYNALVIDGVIALSIRESVREGSLGGMSFFQKTAYIIGGYRYNLHDIEHGILRENRGFPYLPGNQFTNYNDRTEFVIVPMDLRIHFALNCASRSCPPIRFYTSENIDSQLELATRNYISNNTHYDQLNGTLYLSPLFRWYRRDFGNREQIINFVTHYVDDMETYSQIALHNNVCIIRYQKYDWGLNKFKPQEYISSS